MMNHLIHDRRRQEEVAAVERWNRLYPVGTAVVVQIGKVTATTRTASTATLVGNRAVVRLKNSKTHNFYGYAPLSFVAIAEQSPADLSPTTSQIQ